MTTTMNTEQFKVSLGAKEISDFLSPDTRPDIQRSALDHVVGLTYDLDHDTLEIFLDNPKILSSILDLVVQDQTIGTDNTSENINRCLKALINLSGNAHMAVLIARNEPFLEFCVKNVVKSDLKSADRVCKLLCNLSRDQDISEVIQATMRTVGVSVQHLVNVCVDISHNVDVNYNFMPLFLQNLSQLHEIRVAILDKSRCIVQKLLPQINHEVFTEERRRGVAGLVKNCCFETECHDWLLSDDVDILPYLLRPLTGPEEFTDEEYNDMPIDIQYLPLTKTREPVAEIRLILVEAVMKLCCTKAGRCFIKDKNTYLIMRELDRWEKDPAVSVALEKLISLLIGDEPEEGMENLHAVEIPDAVISRLETEGAKDT